MKKYLIPIGIVLLVAAGIWKLGLSPRWEQRITPDWSWEYDIFGTYANFEDEAGFETSTEDDEVVSSRLRQYVDQEGMNQDSVTILSDYQELDTVSGEVEYSYTDQKSVNPQTSQFTDPDLSEYYFVFPRNLEQRDYALWDTYYGVMTFEYVGEESYGRLNTYRFEYTPELVDETEGYLENEWIEEGQAVGCLDTVVSYFVEPITGEIVVTEEDCPREYLLDPETLEPVAPYGRWHYSNTGDSIQRRVAAVQSMKATYLQMTIYVPLALAIGGILLLIAGIFLNRSAMNNQNKR